MMQPLLRKKGTIIASGHYQKNFNPLIPPCFGHQNPVVVNNQIGDPGEYDQTVDASKTTEQNPPNRIGFCNGAFGLR
jgi:hypothetical protein